MPLKLKVCTVKLLILIVSCFTEFFLVQKGCSDDLQSTQVDLAKAADPVSATTTLEEYHLWEMLYSYSVSIAELYSTMSTFLSSNWHDNSDRKPSRTGKKIEF